MGMYAWRDLFRARHSLLGKMRGTPHAFEKDAASMKWKGLHWEDGIFKASGYHAPCNGELAPLCGNIWKEYSWTGTARVLYKSSNASRKVLFCERLNLTKFIAARSVLVYKWRERNDPRWAPVHTIQHQQQRTPRLVDAVT